ncbi:MAG: helix-turn-helix domain-containing protein, partial [Vibrio cyclitrophicus]
MYNIEQLKMFVYAVELGSFSASARQLGKVQSAVSQGISNLEIDFNVQLFDRSTR